VAERSDFSTRDQAIALSTSMNTTAAAPHCVFATHNLYSTVSLFFELDAPGNGMGLLLASMPSTERMGESEQCVKSY